MLENVWVGLSARERMVLLYALSSMRPSEPNASADIDALTLRLKLKLVHSEPHPDITVGVYGGQVQWTLGNHFPLRICDYDGNKDELPDVDENGERCRIWFEPVDAVIR